MTTARPARLGKFIAFEGTEGAGKSTLIRLLGDQLNARSQTTVITREPGGSPLSEKLRELILHTQIAPRTELLLYQAARAEHLVQNIRPALEKGNWVLCDRFSASTLAYQAEARGLPWNEVERAIQIATEGLRPDLTIWFDLPPEVGMARVKDPNKFEAEGVGFQKLVRKGYARAYRQEPHRWLKINVNGATPTEILALIKNDLVRRRWI